MQDTINPAKRTDYRGRKMKPGKYLAGPPSVFVCYCGHCQEKVILPVDEVKTFGRYFQRQNKSLKVRTMRVVMRAVGVDTQELA